MQVNCPQAKPPVVAPKPNVVKNGEIRNADRLNYSDLELFVLIYTRSSLDVNIGDKTGYAEVL